MEWQLGKVAQQIARVLDRAQMANAAALVDQRVSLALQIDVEDIDAALKGNQLEGIDTPRIGMPGEVAQVHGKYSGNNDTEY